MMVLGGAGGVWLVVLLRLGLGMVCNLAVVFAAGRLAVCVARGRGVDVCLRCMCCVGVWRAVGCCMGMLGRGWIVELLAGFFTLYRMNQNVYEYYEYNQLPSSSMRFRLLLLYIKYVNYTFKNSLSK